MGVSWECLAFLLGGSNLLQCRREPASWGWLWFLGQVDLFWGPRRLGFKGQLERGWDDVTSLCKSCLLLYLCVVLGWCNGEGVLFLRDRWSISRLIRISSLWDQYTENHERTLPWFLAIFLIWLKIRNDIYLHLYRFLDNNFSCSFVFTFSTLWSIFHQDKTFCTDFSEALYPSAIWVVWIGTLLIFVYICPPQSCISKRVYFILKFILSFLVHSLLRVYSESLLPWGSS